MRGRISSPVLVGREREFQQLMALLDGDRGHGLTLVVGDAGIGKSRLIREWLEAARQRSVVVLLGRCPPVGDAGLPYAPIAEALRSVRGADDLAAVFAEPRQHLHRLLSVPSADSHDAAAAGVAQVRLFEALLDAIEQCLEKTRVIFAVEDLHWSDVQSRQFLGYLSTNQSDGLIVVSTLRSEEARRDHGLQTFLSELDRAQRLDRLEIKPLDRKEVATQVACIRGQSQPETLVEMLHRRSGGNPFFIEELIAATAGNEAVIPPNLREILLARLAALSPSCRTVVRHAAVLGERVDERLLWRLSGLDPASLQVALREAVDHHILVVTEPHRDYAFRHSLMREAIYADLLPGERRSMHEQAAVVLAKRADSSARSGTFDRIQLAHHWDAAERWDQALPALASAAHASARSSAYAEALTLSDRALEVWDMVPTDVRAKLSFDRVSLLELAGRSAEWAGELETGLARVREALRVADDRDELARLGMLHQAESTILWELGDEEGSFAAAERALSAVPSVGHPVERGWVTMCQGSVCNLLGRFEEARRLGQEALECALQTGVTESQSCALSVLGMATASVDSVDHGIRLLREGLAVAQQSGSPRALSMAYFNLEYVLALIGGAWEDAAQLCEEWQRVANQLRIDRSPRPHADGVWVEALWRLGRWDEAEKLVVESLAAPSEFAPARLELLHCAATLYVAKGRTHEAEALVGEAESVNGSMLATQAIAPVAAARAELEVARGAPAIAIAAYQAALDRLAGREDPVLTRRLHAMAVRGHVEQAMVRRRGRAERWRSEAKEAAEAALDRLSYRTLTWVTKDLPETVAWRDQAAAELSRLGEEAEAERWEALARAWAEVGWDYQVAYARFREAEAWLARRGGRRLARSPAQEAYAVAARLGAEPLRFRIEALAGRARIEIAPVRRGASRPKAPLGLTEREVEVLLLIAKGLSNRDIAERLFISEKTAAVHVSNILGKLEVAGRTEAAAVAFRVGLVDAAAESVARA